MRGEPAGGPALPLNVPENLAAHATYRVVGTPDLGWYDVRHLWTLRVPKPPVLPVPEKKRAMADPTELLQQTNFTAIDWVIVILYPLISVGIGLYVRKLIVNMSDFVVAGRGLGVCLGIATMTGTELGLITVMYSSQKGFVGGFAAFHIALVAGMVTFLVGATGFFVYRLREMGVMTIPEFYERRFDRKTRILGGIMMALGGVLNMGLFL